MQVSQQCVIHHDTPPPCGRTSLHNSLCRRQPSALRRETFRAQIGQDAHYLAAVTNCYTLAQAKATLEGPVAFAAIRELLADCHEELSLHEFYAEVRRDVCALSNSCGCYFFCSVHQR
jgi:hypothetical protein